MKARKTRRARGPVSLCARCGVDCTDCEWALTPEGAQRLRLLGGDIVCHGCERLSREVQS